MLLDVLNKHKSSMEAIDFQINSAFPKELDMIFQNVFDFLYEYEEKHRGNDEYTAQNKFEQLYFFLEKKTTTDLKRCIYKHTGINISSFELIKPFVGSDVFDFGMYTSSNSNAFRHIRSSITGFEINDSDDLKKAIRVFSELSNSLDKRSGKLGTKHNPLGYMLCIPIGIFSIKDLIKDGEKYQLSTQEITAAVLHEIGHTLTFIEYSQNVAYTGYYGNTILSNISDYLKAHPDRAVDEVLDIVQIYKSDVKKNTVMSGIVNALERFADKKEDSYTKFPQLSYFLFMLLFAIFSLFYSIYVFSKNILFSPEYISQEFDNIDKNNSRDIITSKNLSMMERLADEYVQRFQYGKYIIGFFEKAHAFDKANSSSNPGFTLSFSKQLQNSKHLILITQILTIPDRFVSYLNFIKKDGISSTYEHHLLRLRRNIDNLHVALKHKNMPEKVTQSILNDIDYMEDQLAEASKGVHLNAIEKSLRFVMNIIPKTAIGIYDIFSKNNPYKEYEHLFEYLDSMLSNKSFYYAAKIKTLMKR